MVSEKTLYMREWTRKNPEKKKEIDRRSYQKHAKTRILMAKNWAEKNVEKTRQYKIKWAEKNPEHNLSKIRFKGKRVQLDHNPRTGICSKCGKTVESGEIKRTAMHHKEYDESNPLAHTVELCVSCHTRLHANKITL